MREKMPTVTNDNGLGDTMLRHNHFCDITIILIMGRCKGIIPGNGMDIYGVWLVRLSIFWRFQQEEDGLIEP